MSGLQLGHKGQRSEFWQINIGHVLQMGMMAGSMMLLGAHLISGFATQTAALESVKGELSDMRTWKDHQDTENTEWRTTINANFDEIKRHLERLDWIVGDRPDAQQSYPAPPRPRTRKE